MRWRYADQIDAVFLAEWNHRLIREEGHRNRMTVPELADRMRGWLQGEYKAVIFSSEVAAVGYAVFREETEIVYLRQFFIDPESRRRGYGRSGFEILRDAVWPKDKRLVVEVLCHNPSGIAFWRAMGYTEYCLTLEIMPDVKNA